MPNIFGEKERRGDQGRKPDSQMENYNPYVKKNFSIDPETLARLDKYAKDEERAMSWIVRKALDEWLTSKGY